MVLLVEFSIVTYGGFAVVVFFFVTIVIILLLLFVFCVLVVTSSRLWGDGPCRVVRWCVW